MSRDGGVPTVSSHQGQDECCSPGLTPREAGQKLPEVLLAQSLAGPNLMFRGTGSPLSSPMWIAATWTRGRAPLPLHGAPSTSGLPLANRGSILLRARGMLPEMPLLFRGLYGTGGEPGAAALV